MSHVSARSAIADSIVFQQLQKLYAASELAQHLIKARAKSHSWALDSYPGKVKLPGDIFKALPNPEAANKVTIPGSVACLVSEHCCSQILKTVYLPENILSWLAEKHSKSHADKVSLVSIPTSVNHGLIPRRISRRANAKHPRREKPLQQRPTAMPSERHINNHNEILTAEWHQQETQGACQTEKSRRVRRGRCRRVV